MRYIYAHRYILTVVFKTGNCQNNSIIVIDKVDIINNLSWNTREQNCLKVKRQWVSQASQVEKTDLGTTWHIANSAHDKLGP